MKYFKITAVLILLSVQYCLAQQKVDNKKAINAIINTYSESVKERDSLKFYRLFNDGPVTWSGAVKDYSQAMEIKKKGAEKTGSNYFSGTYKGFMRGLFTFSSAEDKFRNIRIVEDGAVASVTMDYSFWANSKMTNWGGKYLMLIKRDGAWKITSVIYSVELAEYMQQPALSNNAK